MAFKFPKEIKDLLRILGDETRWKILESIINTDNKQSYAEIKHNLNIPDDGKGPFNYHLKELQKAGWLRNTLEKESEDSERSKSYYAISKFGLKVVQGALQAMQIETYSMDPLAGIIEPFTKEIKYEDLMLISPGKSTFTFNDASESISASAGTISWSGIFGETLKSESEERYKNLLFYPTVSSITNVGSLEEISKTDLADTIYEENEGEIHDLPLIASRRRRRKNSGM